MKRLDEGDGSELRIDDMECIRESVLFGWKMRLFRTQHIPLLPRTPEFYLEIKWSLTRTKSEECQDHAGNLNTKNLVKNGYIVTKSLITMIQIRYIHYDGLI